MLREVATNSPENQVAVRVERERVDTFEGERDTPGIGAWGPR